MKLSLIFAVCLLCPFTFAKTNELRKKPAGPPRETEEQKEDARSYALDNFIDAWNANVHSGKDLNILMPKNLDEKRRREFLASAETMGPAPVITRDGHELTFELPNVKAVIQWPHFGQTKMSIGGVNFAYDTSVSVAQNMKMFDQRMGIFDKSAANPLDLFLPQAEAANPLAVFKLMTKTKAGEWVISGLKKIKCSSSICNSMLTFTGASAFFSSSDSKCFLFAVFGAHPWAWTGHATCLEWKKQQDAYQALATTTLLKQTAEADGKRWVPRNWQCPKIDKDTYEYTSWMRQVQVIDDTHTQELGNWRFLKAKFSKVDNPKLVDIKVFASEEDSKKLDVNAPIYKLSFDPDSPGPMLTSIQSRVDNPADNDDNDYKTVLVADASKDTYRDSWGRMQSLAEGTVKAYINCQYVKFMNQFDPSGLKMDLQSALSKPGAPVPAAASEQATIPGSAPAPDAKK